MKKTFESLTIKTTKFFFFFEKRNWRDRQKALLKKSDLIPIFFKIRNPIGREESSRNRNTHENRFDLLKGIRQESKGLETFKRKSYFSPSHFNRSKTSSIRQISKTQKFWKFLENFSVESFENCFLWYGMNVHDFKWSSKLKFSKKNSTISNFLTPFFSRSPKMH